MDISERSAFVKRWLNWDHKRDNQASILSSMLNKGIFIFFLSYFLPLFYLSIHSLRKLKIILFELKLSCKYTFKQNIKFLK